MLLPEEPNIDSQEERRASETLEIWAFGSKKKPVGNHTIISTLSPFATRFSKCQSCWMIRWSLSQPLWILELQGFICFLNLNGWQIMKERLSAKFLWFSQCKTVWMGQTIDLRKPHQEQKGEAGLMVSAEAPEGSLSRHWRRQWFVLLLLLGVGEPPEG